jgi:hypothetical protein
LQSDAKIRIVSLEIEYCSISESIEGIIYGLNTSEYNMIGLSQIIDNKDYLITDRNRILPEVISKIYVILLFVFIDN